MDYKAHPKENLYFAVKILCTVIVLFALVGIFSVMGKAESYLGASTFAVFAIYALFIWLFIIFQKIFLVGYLKGNGVPVTERQFPEIHSLYLAMARDLGLTKVPALFVVQQGGALNAFAVRFSGKNYVAIYSDVMALAAKDQDAVKFILGHELGHVRRNHMSKRFWTFLSSLVPFLTPAYSRACEYTCDTIGAGFSREGAKGGLLLLAAGKELYQSLDVGAYIADSQAQATASAKFAGICASHPYLPKRLKYLGLA